MRLSIPILSLRVLLFQSVMRIEGLLVHKFFLQHLELILYTSLKFKLAARAGVEPA